MKGGYLVYSGQSQPFRKEMFSKIKIIGITT